MKKLLAYFFGGLACLGVGAGGYIAIGTYSRPAAGIQSTPGDQLGLDSRLRGNDGKTSTIFFGGDIMLGRAVAAKIAKNGNGYPFAKTKDTIAAADYAMANLEGPITSINNDPENELRLHFDPSAVAVLPLAGFDAVSLANNHVLDQGAQGFTDTKNNLTDNGIAYFGDASDDNGPILHFTVGGTNFAAIGAQDVYRQIDPTAIAKEIAVEKAVGNFVIVYPHWGVEYSHSATARQTTLAHAFIDADADMVVGSHPHVVEGIEVYKGKPIFYSLGNSVFDQFFSADTQQGLGLRLNIDASGNTSIDLLPYEIPQSQPSFVVGDKEQKMLEALASYSAPALKDQIILGSIKLGE